MSSEDGNSLRNLLFIIILTIIVALVALLLWLLRRRNERLRRELQQRKDVATMVEPKEASRLSMTPTMDAAPAVTSGAPTASLLHIAAEVPMAPTSDVSPVVSGSRRTSMVRMLPGDRTTSPPDESPVTSESRRQSVVRISEEVEVSTYCPDQQGPASADLKARKAARRRSSTEATPDSSVPRDDFTGQPDISASEGPSSSVAPSSTRGSTFISPRTNPPDVASMNTPAPLDTAQKPKHHHRGSGSNSSSESLSSRASLTGSHSTGGKSSSQLLRVPALLTRRASTDSQSSNHSNRPMRYTGDEPKSFSKQATPDSCVPRDEFTGQPDTAASKSRMSRVAPKSSRGSSFVSPPGKTPRVASIDTSARPDKAKLRKHHHRCSHSASSSKSSSRRASLQGSHISSGGRKMAAGGRSSSELLRVPALLTRRASTDSTSSIKSNRPTRYIGDEPKRPSKEALSDSSVPPDDFTGQPDTAASKSRMSRVAPKSSSGSSFVSPPGKTPRVASMNTSARPDKAKKRKHHHRCCHSASSSKSSSRRASLQGSHISSGDRKIAAGGKSSSELLRVPVLLTRSASTDSNSSIKSNRPTRNIGGEPKSFSKEATPDSCVPRDDFTDQPDTAASKGPSSSVAPKGSGGSTSVTPRVKSPDAACIDTSAIPDLAKTPKHHRRGSGSASGSKSWSRQASLQGSPILSGGRKISAGGRSSSELLPLTALLIRRPSTHCKSSNQSNRPTQYIGDELEVPPASDKFSRERSSMAESPPAVAVPTVDSGPKGAASKEMK